MVVRFVYTVRMCLPAGCVSLPAGCCVHQMGCHAVHQLTSHAPLQLTHIPYCIPSCDAQKRPKLATDGLFVSSGLFFESCRPRLEDTFVGLAICSCVVFFFVGGGLKFFTCQHEVAGVCACRAHR